MVDDLAAHVYTDNFFMVYVGGKYMATEPSVKKAEQYAIRADGEVAVYEVNKAEQTSQRVF